MKVYALDICPNEGCGLCNQLYSIVAGIKYCINNKINIIFINKFLKSINTNKYCSISEILNLQKFNQFLTKYGIFICDVNNFQFRISNAEIYNGEIIQDITEDINKNFYTNNCLYIKKNTQFCINNNDNKNLRLKITFILDTGFFIENYLIEDGKLIDDINYNFQSLDFTGNFKYQQDELFFDILRNIPFSEIIVNKSLIKNLNLLENKKTNNINTIHLRIEDDVIEFYSKLLNIDKNNFKKFIEDKFINIIDSLMNKTDLIIVLSYSLDNRVLEFLEKNCYNYIINTEKDEDREISAINDLLLGENCNNYYICVWESSYSYTLLCRINKNKNVKCLQMYYESPYKDFDYFRLLY
jgi:hypothetical protein